MKERRWLAAALLALALGIAGLWPGWTRAASTRRVSIYLTDPRIDSPRNPFSLAPVPRSVPAGAPINGALRALLAGPTARERAAGLRGVEGEGLSVGSLSVAGGTARVNFVSRRPKSWNGTLSAPRFREAVTRTLRQFSGVRSVRVSVNGNPSFDSQRGAVPTPRPPDDPGGVNELCNEAGDVGYTATQSGGRVTLTAEGQHLTGGFSVRFEQSPLRIYPPQYVLRHRRPTGMVTEAITPFTISAGFAASETVRAVVVQDARGRHEVTVRSASR